MLEILQMKHKHDMTWIYKTLSTMTPTLQKENSTFWMTIAGENRFNKVGHLYTSGQHQSIYQPPPLLPVLFM